LAYPGFDVEFNSKWVGEGERDPRVTAKARQKLWYPISCLRIYKYFCFPGKELFF